MAAALGYRPDASAARLCFHLQQPSYNTDALIGVLEQLAGFYAGHKVVLLWDGLSAHWSTRMRAVGGEVASGAAWDPVHQQPVQTVDGLGSCGDQVLAPLGQQLQHHRLILDAGLP